MSLPTANEQHGIPSIWSRFGDRTTVKAMTTVIVGAGLAGLTAAWHLVTAGVAGEDVTVLEGSHRVGGKLAVAEIAGHGIDVGAESMLAVRPEASGLVREVGLGEALTTPATTSASV